MKGTIHTHGKRKMAIARATIRPGKGLIKINGQNLTNFGTEILRLRLSEPLILAGDLAHKINADIIVQSGGVNGQTDAARLALARALVKCDDKLKKTFESYDRLLLVADVRRKETRKPNDSKARAARQKSYR
ncbi:TPA: 30S ribosomal protein S9 [Candidatus Woesearchaeota archaeon]|nr:30S ribosomal protein S9 [Candidatus Woesearchaeota archaeon]